VVRLRFAPDAKLKAIDAGGVLRRFAGGGDKEDYVFRCHGRSCDGLTLRLLVGAPGPVEATLVGMRSGLPASANALLTARPATAQPQYAPDASYSVARIRL
jgi:hypothetical protein